MKKIYYLIAMAVTAFTFTSCEDVPEPFGQPVNPNAGETIVVDPTGSGTEADPYNVAKLTEVTKALADGDVVNDVYAKGYICQIDDIDTGSYGNSTYWISDDAEGKSGKYEVYRGIGLGGQKFNEAGATLIKVGDAVTIKGNIKNFKGTTPEYDSGSIIVELNGVKAGTGGGGGSDTPTETIGTKDAPLTIAQALEKINALGDGKESELNAYVKGKVVKVTTNQTNFEKYGNLNYLISEDGTENNTITVYSGDGLDGAKFTGIDALSAGDEVIVFGKLYKYVKDSKVTPEIAKGNYLVSLVKGGGSSTGGDTTGGDSNVTTSLEGTVLTLINGGVTASANTVSVDLNTYGWTNNSIPTTVTLTDGTTIVFAKGEGGSDPKFYEATKGVRMYAKNTLTITGSSKAIAKVVLTCDSYNGTDYVGNTQLYGTASGNALTIVNDHTATSGGVQLRVKTIDITYAQ